MASHSQRGVALFRTALGFWQLGPVATRERATQFPSLLGCQRKCVSCVAGAAFSGPLLASASRRYGQNSALDRLLGISQPDTSLTPRVPAVSIHRGKGPRQICPGRSRFLITGSAVLGKPLSPVIIFLARCYQNNLKATRKVSSEDSSGYN